MMGWAPKINFEVLMSAEAGMSVSIHDVVFRDFKDFEPHAGTPIDIMHNMESGMMADLLEV